MIKYEYKIIDCNYGISHGHKTHFNELGADGWELCVYDNENHKLVFKKAVIDNNS